MGGYLQSLLLQEGFTLPFGGGGGTPGGSNQDVQFNDSGSFGGAASLLYDKSAGSLQSVIGSFIDTGQGIAQLDISGPGLGTFNLPSLIAIRSPGGVGQPYSIVFINQTYSTASTGDFIYEFIDDDGTLNTLYDQSQTGFTLDPDGDMVVYGQFELQDASFNAAARLVVVLDPNNIAALTLIEGVTIAHPVTLGLPQFSSDPTTTSWNSTQKGRAWFNTTSDVVKYWDGSAIQTLSNAPASADDFAVAAFAPGVGTDAQKLLRIKLTQAVKFPAGAANSEATASANATGDTTFTLKKNGSSFATVLFGAGDSSGVWTQASDANFVAGDLLEIDGPATADATLADVGITLAGLKQ
jgi:hypothetical protein